jgi:hypothetical protein
MELNFHVKNQSIEFYFFLLIDQLIIMTGTAQPGGGTQAREPINTNKGSCSIDVEDLLLFGFCLVVVKAAAKQLTTTTTTTRGAANERAVLRAQQWPCFAVFCPDPVACTGGKFALSIQQPSRMSLTVNLSLELRCCNSVTFLR